MGIVPWPFWLKPPVRIQVPRHSSLYARRPARARAWTLRELTLSSNSVGAVPSPSGLVLGASSSIAMAGNVVKGKEKEKVKEKVKGKEKDRSKQPAASTSMGEDAQIEGGGRVHGGDGQRRGRSGAQRVVGGD